MTILAAGQKKLGYHVILILWGRLVSLRAKLDAVREPQQSCPFSPHLPNVV